MAAVQPGTVAPSTRRPGAVRLFAGLPRSFSLPRPHQPHLLFGFPAGYVLRSRHRAMVSRWAFWERLSRPSIERSLVRLFFVDSVEPRHCLLGRVFDLLRRGNVSRGTCYLLWWVVGRVVGREVPPVLDDLP